MFSNEGDYSNNLDAILHTILTFRVPFHIFNLIIDNANIFFSDFAYFCEVSLARCCQSYFSGATIRIVYKVQPGSVALVWIVSAMQLSLNSQSFTNKRR